MDDKPVILVLRGLIKDQDGKYLLMQRSSKSKSWPDLWEFPGGKVAPREAHADAFMREMEEETGLSARPGRLLAEFEWEREADIILYRIFQAVDVSGTFRISDEHEDFGWFLPEEVKRLSLSPPLVGVADRLCH